MSKYTIELRYICESIIGLDKSVPYPSVNDVINQARPKIFDFSYPIFDENYRSVLETKILKHFYTREIGLEAFGLWKLQLETKLNEIMPYYNQRYKSELIEFNPLFDTDITENKDDTFDSLGTNTNGKNVTNSGKDRTITDDKTVQQNSGTDTRTLARTGSDTVEYDDRNNSNITQTNENWKNESTTDWHFEADTPQSTIAGVDDNVYSTRAVKDTHVQAGTVGSSSSPNYEKTINGTNYSQHNDTETTYGSTDTTTDVHGKKVDTDYDGDKTLNYGKVTDTRENLKSVLHNTDDYLHTIIGKRSAKSYSQMLTEFRNTFLNIDMEIIEELKPLFFNLW